jgi:hypothetical protein
MVHRLRNSYYPVQGFFVRKLPKNSYAEGVTRPNDTTIYIGEDALKDGVAATALEIFGEFQHSGPGGGRFDGPDVQKELEEVRRMFPKKDRTLFVDAIHHGGQINHLP